MANKLIHARMSEHNSKNGTRGDQTTNEVSITNYYNHTLGWYTLRAYNSILNRYIRKYAQLLANNNNVGYSQSDRLSLLNELSSNNWEINKIKPCNCDCSSFVRVCIILACRELSIDYKKITNFTTSNEKSVLLGSGLFYLVTTGNKMDGDILVTKKKGHTAIYYEEYTVKPVNTKEDIHTIALQCIRGDWGNGTDRRKRLEASGYIYSEVQNEINRLLKG